MEKQYFKFSNKYFLFRKYEIKNKAGEYSIQLKVWSLHNLQSRNSHHFSHIFI